MGGWAHGSVGPWEAGPMGVWAHGSVGPWEAGPMGGWGEVYMKCTAVSCFMWICFKWKNRDNHNSKTLNDKHRAQQLLGRFVANLADFVSYSNIS